MTAVTADSLRWQDFGACRDADPALFFGPDEEDSRERETRERRAIAVCARCPAEAECLDWALSFPSQHGVAGGMGEEDRKALRYRTVRGRPLKAAS